MTEKNSKALVPVNQVSSACLICGKEGHSPLECTLSVPVETQISEVSYAQNQGAYSQIYNPAWRNHPNLSYKNANQQSYPQAVQQNSVFKVQLMDDIFSQGKFYLSLKLAP
jgi:hypothetical protein